MRFVKSMQHIIDCATSVPLDHSMQIQQQMHRQIRGQMLSVLSPHGNNAMKLVCCLPADAQQIVPLDMFQLSSQPTES